MNHNFDAMLQSTKRNLLPILLGIDGTDMTSTLMSLINVGLQINVGSGNFFCKIKQRNC